MIDMRMSDNGNSATTSRPYMTHIAAATMRLIPIVTSQSA
ncbi:hypothetical protein JCM19239_157 [Vibrio variabilis]|uniref:Uncharacterized protein n=1 Tax=Vibrio variabilis TaxID=990271 RepID=A0ABQ0JD14_9VIBR|nr:hypothetical protein JCM19239_157 [Vibrio variabilis]